MLPRVRTSALLIGLLMLAPAAAAARTGMGASAPSGAPRAQIQRLDFAGSRILLALDPEEFKLSGEEIADWVLRSARATATFFGRFPVAEVNIAIDAVAGDEVTEGVTQAAPGPEIRVAVGRFATRATLKRDNTMVHEMTHLAFPDIDDRHLWLHEGIATYVEVVARAQALEITPAEAWGEFMDEIPQGLPQRGQGGLDDTPSEDRRYWGGALFCLLADIEIRRRTENRFGLRDALRSVLAAGGTLSVTWDVERALSIADRAIGVPVLGALFAKWNSEPVSVDLSALWERLGVERAGGGDARLVESAALAGVRRAITDMPARPLLLAGPSLLHEASRAR